MKGARFTEMPDIFRRLQNHMLRKDGGDRYPLGALLRNARSGSEWSISCPSFYTTTKALFCGPWNWRWKRVCRPRRIFLNFLHRLIDPKQADHPKIDPPDALALETAPKANVDRYDDL